MLNLKPKQALFLIKQIILFHYREKTYIDGHHTGRILDINVSTREKLDLAVFTGFKLKEDLFLSNLSEVEFASIKWLENLIDSELCWPLLKVAALVQLGDETILTGNHLNQNPSIPTYKMRITPMKLT